MTYARTRFSLLLFAGLTLGCGAPDEGSQALTATRAALLGQDSYLYFRCNATGWGLDGATRLNPTADPSVFTLSYEVGTGWMTTTGDRCVFTESSTLDGWGARNVDYGRGGAGTLQVQPTGATGDRLSAGGSAFPVRYATLGRHTVTVNWRQGTFLIEKRAPVTGRAGTVAASFPGQLSTDSTGAIYARSWREGSQSSLSRVDRDTAEPIWERAIGGDASAPCTSGANVIFGGSQQVTALSRATGAVAWQMTPPEGSSFLCLDAAPSFFLSTATGLSAHSKTWGQRLWTYEGAPYAYVQAVDARNVYFTRSLEDGRTLLHALDRTNGAERWSLPSAPGEYISLLSDGAQRVFAMSFNQLSRLNPETGRPRWTHKGTSEYVSLLSTLGPGVGAPDVSGDLVVSDSAQLVALDAETGAPRWRFDGLHAGRFEYAYAYRLSSRQIVSIASRSDERWSMSLLDPQGRVLWTIERERYTSVYADAQGALYLHSFADRALSALDGATGQTRWSYVHRDGNFVAGVVGSDGDEVFVSYSGPAYRYPPMGVLALSKTTGALLWQGPRLAGPVGLASWSPSKVFVQSFLGGPSLALHRGPAVTDDGRYYMLVSRSSGQCAEIEQLSPHEGARVSLTSCHGGTGQHLRVVQAGEGFVTLVARHSDKPIGVESGARVAGALVQQGTSGGGARRQWRLVAVGDGSFKLVARHSEKVLETAANAGAYGQPLRQGDDVGTPEQRWSFAVVARPLTAGKSYAFLHPFANRCLDIEGASQADGARAIQWSCHGGDNQRWRIGDAGGGGFVTVSARHSGKALALQGSATEEGTPLVQGRGDGSSGQQWRLDPGGAGGFRLVSRAATKVAQVENASMADGALVKLVNDYGPFVGTQWLALTLDAP